MSQRHLQDFGEKLGGARKDLAARMRPREEVGFAEEWPEPDYAQYVGTGGLSVLAARALKELRAQAIGWVEDLAGDEVGIARHAALVSRLCAAAHAAIRAIRDEVTADSLEGLVRSLRANVPDADTREARLRVPFLGWTVFTWRERLRRFDDELERGWPRPARQWTLRFAASGPRRNAGLGPDGAWFVRVERQRWTFPSEEEALHKASELFPDLSFQEPPEFIRLTKIERLGLADFRSGRDVEPQDFLDVFRFRGVEFGNWTSQPERAEHLNRAWDALMDLSAALRLAPSALSLEGRLGLGFGSRGHGGKGAGRAHYEPSYHAINLTRNWGAGSLAHEWWHACDHYLYDTVAGGPSQRPFLSALRWPQPRVPDLGFARLMPQLRGVRLTKVEFSRDLEAQIEVSRATTVATLQRVRFSETELASTHSALVAKTLGLAANPEAAPQAVREAADELRSFWRARGGDDWGYAQEQVLHKGLTSLSSLCSQFVDLRLSAATHVERKSQFLECAQQLDARRTKAYWSTPWELTARAFAAYIEDRLAELGGKNDYLVHSTHCRHPDFQGFAVYPVRAHRQQVAEAFTQVFQQIREDILPGRHRPALEAGVPFTMEALRPRPAVSLEVGPGWNATQMTLI